MSIVYLIIAGIFITAVHCYLVWRYRETKGYSISEYAVVTPRAHLIYVISHFTCDVLVLLFAYGFFIIEHNIPVLFGLFFVFAILDTAQALIPSRGKTEKIHFAAAYISWSCYLLAGIIALFLLTIATPYLWAAVICFVPVISMFVYMHINRARLYPYQLVMVPLYVLAMTFIAIGVGI